MDFSLPLMAAQDTNTSITLIIGLIAIVVLALIFFNYVPFGLWINAKTAGVRISMWQLFLMKLRRVSPAIIVRGMITVHKAGLKNITTDQLEAHYLAGGNVVNVVNALVAAQKIGLELTFSEAAAIDLSGQDVLGAVKASTDMLKEQQIINVNDLKTLYLANGNVKNVVFALVEASDKGILLSLRTAGKIDLAGHDVLEAVHKAVNPLTGKPFTKIGITN